MGYCGIRLRRVRNQIGSGCDYRQFVRGFQRPHCAKLKRSVAPGFIRCFLGVTLEVHPNHISTGYGSCGSALRNAQSSGSGVGYYQ